MIVPRSIALITVIEAVAFSLYGRQNEFVDVGADS
jgi:hypothetical protein